MEIKVNGKDLKIEKEEVNVEDLITHFYPIEVPFFAVALNENFISKSQYQTTQIRNGDKVEILSPNPGG